MPAEDFFRVLDRQITPRVDPHRVMVVLSGGEVLVRSDLERIGRALYDREYPWGMVTNGMALTPQRFDGLLGAGLHSMTVSIDGFEAEHNRSVSPALRRRCAWPPPSLRSPSTP